MTRLPTLLLPALLLISFSAKAFVPVGMMLDVRSYMLGGNLVTICSSAGDLPWRLVNFDHDDDMSMDRMAEVRCPYAALDVPASIEDIKPPRTHSLGQAFYSRPVADLIKILIARPSARGPPAL